MGCLKTGKHPPLYKHPLPYFDSIIPNEQYPMRDPMKVPASHQIVACWPHHVYSLILQLSKIPVMFK